MSDWAVEMLVATALLMVVVLLLRRPVASLFGARAAYALWLAPALRFPLPPVAPAIEAPAFDITLSYTPRKAHRLVDGPPLAFPTKLIALC